MIRFSIRDVLWLTVVVGLGIALAIQHQRASVARQQTSEKLNRLTTVAVVEMPLRDAALYISSMNEIPVLLSDQIDGDRPVTANIKNVPLKTALDGLLPTLGLDYRVKEGWIVIEPQR